MESINGQRDPIASESLKQLNLQNISIVRLTSKSFDQQLLQTTLSIKTTFALDLVERMSNLLSCLREPSHEQHQQVLAKARETLPLFGKNLQFTLQQLGNYISSNHSLLAS